MGKFYDLMDREIRVRGMSERTRETYLWSMRCFVRYFMLPPGRLTVEHVKQYQLHLTKERHVAWSTFNVHVCAILRGPGPARDAQPPPGEGILEGVGEGARGAAHK